VNHRENRQRKGILKYIPLTEIAVSSYQNQNIRITNEAFENVAKFKYFGTTLTNRITFMMKVRVDYIQ
jgi:hypothetical protein